MDNKLQEEIKKLTKGIIVYDLLILLALAITFNLNKQMVLGLVFGTLIAILNLKLLAITINKTVYKINFTNTPYERLFFIHAVVYSNIMRVGRNSATLCIHVGKYESG